ncbi:MAG: hypothetical protein EXR47_06730 [Dehalococcoidia bacterium]|nr:hypothetical protein [Dehalococcoidia bacterium]
MIRQLQPLDLLQAPLWLGGRMCEHSVTLERLGQTGTPRPLPSIARDQLLPRRRPYVWVAEDGGQVVGVAEGQPMAGPRAWSLRRLRADLEAHWPVAELLEQVSAAGGHGARRVFLRLASDSSLVNAAVNAGYVAAWEETLCTHQDPPKKSAPKAVGIVRRRQPADDLALCRLFCSTTPVTVRSAIGMTLEEWRDAHELSPQRAQAWVNVSPDGSVTGAAERWRAETSGCASIQAKGEAVPILLGRVLPSQPKRYLHILAADYQEHLRNELETSRFAPIREYMVLVKSMAAPVREVGFVPASV